MKRALYCFYVVILALSIWLIASLNQERLRLNAMSRLAHGGWDLYFEPFPSSPASIPWERKVWSWLLQDLLHPDYIKEVVGIAGGGGTKEQMQLVDCVRHIPSIYGVYVPNCQHLSAEFFAELSTLPHLKRLNLDGTNVNDDMLRSFSGASNLDSLTLVVTSDLHGDSLKNFKSLKELSINDSGIDDTGARAIAQNCPLSDVSLEETNVTPEALNYLTDMKSLRILGLSKRVFENSPQLNQFRQRRPDVKVVLY